MTDRTKEIIAEIRSELNKGFEEKLWSTSDNKVFSSEEYRKAWHKMASKTLQEVSSKYPLESATIVCDETNNTPEDAAKGVINVTIKLPPFLKKFALDQLGLPNEN